MRIFTAILPLLLFTAVISSGCGSQPPAANAAEKRSYDFRGTVISIDKAAKTARIEHEEIPGLMPAMTMDFPIHEDWIWEDLVPGVDIRAQLVEDKSAKEPYYLEKVVIVAKPTGNAPPVPETTPEQIGKQVPDHKLTDQDGKPFKFSDLKGKAYAVTFIYRDCPLPEFCIKMSKQFSDMARQLIADPDAKDKVKLISVSFDPDRDTPEKLKQYGLGYLGDTGAKGFDIWKLIVGPPAEIKAIADFFGLKYETDAENKDQINHSLVTAVVGTDGKVIKIYNGGRWTPDQIMSDLKSAVSK